jgi:hypothetical protein
MPPNMQPQRHTLGFSPNPLMNEHQAWRREEREEMLLKLSRSTLELDLLLD